MGIYLWDDDISSAYRITKYNPAVNGSLAYVIMNFLFLPIGDIFGSNTSPAEYEPLVRGRVFFAEKISMDEPLVIKYTEILNLVEFDVESEPSKVLYIQATPSTIHKGVYRPANSWDVNAHHKLFVDDTLISETRRHIPTAMATSIEALYVVLGLEQISERRAPISMERFAARRCS